MRGGASFAMGLQEHLHAVAQVGLAALVEYLRWLRDPTPTPALTAQEQLFRLHFGCSLRGHLRSTKAVGLGP